MENDKHNKQKYKELCTDENSISIFSQHWWLDAVAGEENWDVILVEEKGKIIASLPYYFKKRMGFKLITMPRLTPKMGMWIKYPIGQDDTSKLSYEKMIIEKLIEQLPPYDMYLQNFDYSFDNWLPFYWRNFNQTTKYTYIIENIHNHDAVYSDFRSNVKRNIKKAQKMVGIHTENDIKKFYEIYKKTFEIQNIPTPNSLELLSKIDLFCSNRECRKIFFAEDEFARVHAAVYIIWDKVSAYYLMGGSDAALRNSGAMSLLLWEAIKFTSTFVEKFDFEGSMIEPIERFFRSFGAVQKPYFQIRKTNSLLLKLRNAMVD